MTYKGFLKWANDRACDGQWDLDVAMFCTEIATRLYSVPWFKRNKLWCALQGNEIVQQIVNPTNARYLICHKYY